MLWGLLACLLSLTDPQVGNVAFKIGVHRQVDAGFSGRRLWGLHGPGSCGGIRSRFLLVRELHPLRRADAAR